MHIYEKLWPIQCKFLTGRLAGWLAYHPIDERKWFLSHFHDYYFLFITIVISYISHNAIRALIARYISDPHWTNNDVWEMGMWKSILPSTYNVMWIQLVFHTFKYIMEYENVEPFSTDIKDLWTLCQMLMDTGYTLITMQIVLIFHWRGEKKEIAKINFVHDKNFLYILCLFVSPGAPFLLKLIYWTNTQNWFFPTFLQNYQMQIFLWI